MNKTALLFSGQGTQKKGMGYELYKDYDIAVDIFQRAEKILNLDMKEICFSDEKDLLSHTQYAQIAIFLIDYIRYEIFRQEMGVLPSFAAGLSLGEITALTCAQGIKFQDALLLVQKRGQFMQEAAAEHTGSMLAVQGAKEDILIQLCEENSTEGKIAVMANYNSPSQMVLSGHNEVIDKIRLKLEKHGIKAVKINVDASFHSPLMNSAAKKFNEVLKSTTFCDLQFPVISNVTAEPYHRKEEICNLLSQQMCSPVRWNESMQYLHREGVTYYVELSASDTFSKLAQAVTDSTNIRRLDNKSDLDEIAYTVNGLKDHHKKKIQYAEKAVQIVTCTKNHNTDSIEYSNGFIQPYKQLQKIYLQLLDGKTEKREEAFFQNVYDKTALCLKTKKISDTERDSRLKQLEQIYKSEII